MDKSKADKDRALGVLILTVLLILPFAVWNGFVVSRLWHWFVVPLGVPRVGVWHAVGLVLLVRMLTYQHGARDKSESPMDRLSRAIAVSIFAPAVCLGFGAIYHAFA